MKYILALTLLTTAVCYAPAQQYNFAINQVNAPVGTTGNVTLEITLAYSGTVSSASISGFQFRIAANPGVTFSWLDEGATTSNYIFGSDGFGIGATLPGGGPAFPGSFTELIANDLKQSGGITLTDGDIVRLGRLTFDVDPGATVNTPIPITFANMDNSLTDILGNSISNMTFTQGSVTPVPVPEPATILWVGGLLLIAGHTISRINNSMAASTLNGP